MLAAARGRLADVASLVLIGAVTVGVGVINGSFTGFPKGYDAYAHMSKIRLLVDYFPNVDWNFEWYSGQLYSAGSFPPLFHYLGALLAGAFGVSPANAIVVLAACSCVVTAFGVYGMVVVATENRPAALLAGLLVVSSSGFWVYIVEAGLYPRLMGMAFVAAFGFFALLYFKRRRRWAFVLAVLMLAGAVSSHLLLGYIAVAFALLVVAFLPERPMGKLADAARMLIPALALTAYFDIPYAQALTRPAPLPLLTHEYTALPVSALAVPGRPGGQFESLPFFLMPAAVALIATLIARRRSTPPLVRTLVAVMAVAGAASLVYSFVGLLEPGLFIYAFQPGQGLFFASIFLAGVVGAGLSVLKLPVAGVATLVVAMLAYTLITAPDVVRGEYSGDNPVKRQLQSALPLDPAERQFRVGVSWDAGSDWIGSVADVPQTRGYQQQAVLNPDWQYWLEQDLWSSSGNYDEKNFLLDWYAVKNFYAGPDPAVVRTFEARPDLYAPLASGLPVEDRTFEFRGAGPILSATSARSALVIGADADYTLVVKSFALSGFASSSVIPIRGGAYIDDHSAAELGRFSAVVLYGFKAHDPARAMSLLAGYVRGGGGLVMEANNAPYETADSAPDPIPGGRVARIGVGPGWDFQATPASLADGVNLGAFAPARYEGGPWGVSYIPAGDVKAWATPVLLSGGRPVVVAGVLGAGRVVWSGMNLPFHAVDNSAEEESRLLDAEIAWVAPDAGVAGGYDPKFINPESRAIAVSGEATGVLFKESWFEDWHATVGGVDVPIYRAGPDFMYVPLASHSGRPVTVDFRFSRSILEWTGDVISLVSLALLLAYLVAGPRLWAWARRRRGRRPSPAR